MKIIKFNAENFKRLTAVEITPQGNVVQITGKNGAGKTSILDAIMCAFEGTKNAPDVPIHKGAEKATVTVNLGDFIITRTWKGDTSTLKITNPDNSIKQKPQAILDSLLGRFTFNPMSFMDAKAADRRETLLQMIDLKLPAEWTELGEQTPESDPLSYIAERRKEIYRQRTDIGRDLDKANGALSSAQASLPLGQPPMRISVSKLAEKLRSAEAANSESKAAADKINRGAAKVIEINKLIDEKQDLIVRLQDEVNKLISDKKAVEEICSKIKVAPEIDTSAISAEIQAADAQNQTANEYETKYNNIKTLKSQETALSGEYNALTEKLKRIDAIKENMLSGAVMPIAGLSIAEGDVVFNGIAFKDCSHAERLKISMAIGMVLNPKIRVMRITDGEKFDSDSWKIIHELADANDFQVWIEKMDESGEVGVFIEDGTYGAKAEENKAIDKEIE